MSLVQLETIQIGYPKHLDMVMGLGVVNTTKGVSKPVRKRNRRQNYLIALSREVGTTAFNVDLTPIKDYFTTRWMVFSKCVSTAFLIFLTSRCFKACAINS